MPESLFTQPVSFNVTISFIDLIAGVIMSFVLGFGVTVVYRFTHRGFTFERGFLSALTLIGPIVAMVMMFIGSNLALSLGMVGALSIIRFRTVIKDSRDMVFLFWVIVNGLGCGTYNYFPTLLFTVILGLIVYIMHLFQFGQSSKSEYIIVVKGIGDVDIVRAELDRSPGEFRLRSLEMDDGHWELTMESDISNEHIDGDFSIVNALKKMDSVQRVSVLAPKISLPI